MYSFYKTVLLFKSVPFQEFLTLVLLTIDAFSAIYINKLYTSSNRNIITLITYTQLFHRFTIFFKGKTTIVFLREKNPVYRRLKYFIFRVGYWMVDIFDLKAMINYYHDKMILRKIFHVINIFLYDDYCKKLICKLF